MVPDIEVFGGIVLNKAVGGINPVAVESMALTRGLRGRVVYMPTNDAAARNPRSPTAVAVSRNGQLLPEVLEVLKIVAKYDLCLSTGHVSTEEALMVIRAAKDAGVKKIYVQHPNHGGLVMSMAQMKEAVRMGALIEIVLSGEGFTGGGPKVINAENPVMDYGPQKLADIRALGPANIVISTDLGQPGRVNYAQAFQMALTVLAKSGFSQAEIDMMTKQNPARLLGLK
jgi:dihydroorotase-like cyclic amidohydrolase